MVYIDPAESKLGALLSMRPVDFRDRYVLYLGAGAGTTVSFLEKEARALYCVEPFPEPMTKFLERVHGENVIPIMESARSCWRYIPMVERVDILYQDVAQRDQADIFCRNWRAFEPELGILMIKAMSISQDGRGWEMVKTHLDEEGLAHEVYDLYPHVRDHMALVVT